MRKGDISAEELLDAAIEGAKKVNPDLNFIVKRMYEEAKAAVKAGLPEGPFTGVPFVLKDLLTRYAVFPMSTRLREAYATARRSWMQRKALYRATLMQRRQRNVLFWKK